MLYELESLFLDFLIFNIQSILVQPYSDKTYSSFKEKNENDVSEVHQVHR